MRGAEIVCCTKDNNRVINGIITDTSKPGTMMELKPSTEPVGGLHSYRAYQPGTGDGSPKELLILDLDSLQGGTASTAYVAGTVCKLYALLPGDRVNVRKADISGTGSPTEADVIGDRLLIVDGTGKVANTAVGVEHAKSVRPFVLLETLSQGDQQAESLVYCRVSGF